MAEIIINEVSQNYSYNIGTNSYATVALPITACWGPGLEANVPSEITEDKIEALTWNRFPATQAGLEAFVATYRGAASLYRTAKDYSYQMAMSLLSAGYDVLVCRMAPGAKAQGTLHVGNANFAITAKYTGTFGNNLKVVAFQKELITGSKKYYYNIIIYVVDPSGTQTALENLSFVLDEMLTTDNIPYIDDLQSKYIDIVQMSDTSDNEDVVTLAGGVDYNTDTDSALIDSINWYNYRYARAYPEETLAVADVLLTHNHNGTYGEDGYTYNGFLVTAKTPGDMYTTTVTLNASGLVTEGDDTLGFEFSVQRTNIDKNKNIYDKVYHFYVDNGDTHDNKYKYLPAEGGLEWATDTFYGRTGGEAPYTYTLLTEKPESWNSSAYYIVQTTYVPLSTISDSFVGIEFVGDAPLTNASTILTASLDATGKVVTMEDPGLTKVLDPGTEITNPSYLTSEYGIKLYGLEADAVTASILYKQTLYSLAFAAYDILTDKLTYNPQRYISPGWDDQDLAELGGDKIQFEAAPILSALHIKLLYIAYFGRCGTAFIDVPKSLPRRFVYNEVDANNPGYAQKLARYEPENSTFDINVPLYVSHSALFAPWGQYTYVGTTKQAVASPSFLALLMQRAMILNQSLQYEWCLPTNRRHNLRLGKFDYNIPAHLLKEWQKLSGVGVNCLTSLPDLGNTIWGNSTLFEVPPATYQALANLSTRFLVNAVEDIVYRCGIAITFQYNNGQAYDKFYAGVTPLLDTMKNVGAIENYYVTMSADINGLDQVNANTVIGKIYLVVNGVINDIIVDLVALPPQTDLSQFAQ